MGLPTGIKRLERKTYSTSKSRTRPALTIFQVEKKIIFSKSKEVSHSAVLLTCQLQISPD